jgi:hypothetical protein
MTRGIAIGLALVVVLPPGLGAAEAQGPRAGGGRFEFKLERAGLTSAGVYDRAGKLVRTLWAVKELAEGTHTAAWDGRDEFGEPAGREVYEYRVVVNRGSYQNVGIIGNSGSDPKTHTPGDMRGVVVDAAGSVYTANDWEEAGADFKKWDADGRSVYDAAFQIRNGDPNGAAYAIAVDDGHIYCAVGGWPRPPYNARQVIERFRLRDGTHEPFTDAAAGQIRLYEWPEKLIPPGTPEADAALMKRPLLGLAVAGRELLVADALGGKVHRFDKTTGRRLGGFDVRLPTAVAVGPDGRIWVGHERRNVSAFSPQGGDPTRMIGDIGEVRSLAFGPAARLYVVDGASSQVKIYKTDDTRATLIGGFGRKAVPGDWQADRFYDLRGAGVDRTGGFVTIQAMPLGGVRLARWSNVGRRLWEQMGLEFVSLGTYAQTDPDEFITLQFQRYRLTRTPTPRWEYRGNLFGGDPRYAAADVHGVPRIVSHGGQTFFYTARGDGMQVYRRVGDVLRPAAMIGGRWPTPDGRRDEHGPLGQWTWHDADGDGAVDRAELTWFRRPGAGKYAVLGMNVDERGNVLYCDQDSRSIWEMPLSGLDAQGNPLYDWRRARTIVPRDRSRARLSPLMAVRSSDGTLYALCRSEAWPEPKNAGAWMGGWALSRHDAAGSLLWAVPLPQVCVGLDAVPGGGGGAMLGWYEKGHVFHYNADGLHVGTATPGPAAGGTTGWLDNTAALAVNRDPRDGLIDAFTSDNYLYRILWYRIDDRQVKTIRGRLAR